MGLLDFITGGGGYDPAYMPADLASNMVPPSATDTLGNVVGGPAPNAPMPMARPPEAGPSAADMGLTSAPAGLPLAPPSAPRGSIGSKLVEAIFGPEAAQSFDKQGGMRRVSAALAGGLSQMNGQPFAGQAFGNAMGGSLTGAQKFDDNEYKQKLEALDRALKNKAIDTRADANADLTDWRFNGQLPVMQQKANQTGVYQNGRLAIGQQNADAGTLRAQTGASVAPSTIARNNSTVDLNASRVAGADRTSLTQADSQADRWRAETGKTLRQERDTIMRDYALPSDQKTAKLADINRRLQDADNQYFQMKADNRKARGLDENGRSIPKASTAKPAAAPGSEISMGGDGTRQSPYAPKVTEDFADIPSGAHYIDPGDGKLYVKD